MDNIKKYMSSSTNWDVKFAKRRAIKNTKSNLWHLLVYIFKLMFFVVDVWWAIFSGVEKAKEKILQFMKKKKMETSMRLQQMLLDLDITDNDFLVQQSNSCSRRISSLKSFNGGFQEWSQHMYFMLNATKKNIQIENLTNEIL